MHKWNYSLFASSILLYKTARIAGCANNTLQCWCCCHQRNNIQGLLFSVSVQSVKWNRRQHRNVNKNSIKKITSHGMSTMSAVHSGSNREIESKNFNTQKKDLVFYSKMTQTSIFVCHVTCFIYYVWFYLYVDCLWELYVSHTYRLVKTLQKTDVRDRPQNSDWCIRSIFSGVCSWSHLLSTNRFCPLTADLRTFVNQSPFIFILVWIFHVYDLWIKYRADMIGLTFIHSDWWDRRIFRAD